jgi:putative membrane protein insertion efficiency factor
MIARALLVAIRFYSRAISPALPPRCRFYPTCSAYAAEAVQRHGAARGTWLAVRRLLKCGTWHPGGVDLVPGAEPHSGTADVSHSSSTPAPPSAAAAARRPHRATPPDLRRANEESSVA